MHFNDHQLKILTSTEGKILKKVLIYFWVNRLNPDAQIDLIDNVELVFTDESSIVVTCNEESTGINVLDDFNFEEEKVNLKTEFGDKIKIIPIDASGTKMWIDVIGQTIQAFELSKELLRFSNNVPV